MIRYLVLPKIGMNMTDGTIVEWLVKPGDRIEKEQMVLRAETDKSVQDIFATESGTVLKLLADCGDTVLCQQKIAAIGDEGDTYTGEEEEQPAAAQESAKAAPAPSAAPVSAPAHRADGERLRISPLAKKVAKEMGLELSSLSPAEPGKRIVKADVLRCAEAAAAAPAAVETEEDEFIPYSRMRKTIARHMTESASEKPRVCLNVSVDCAGMMELREKLKSRRKISYNEIIAKACARALRDHPGLNAVTAEGGIIVRKRVNIGVAVDAPAGLLVPVLRDVDKKGLFMLSDELEELIERVKSGTQKPDDLSGGTFTVTNLGSFGVESFDPIINSPECFILGVGSMKKQPAVNEDGELCVKTLMQISLSFDHAAFDGAAAAKLLRSIREYLEEPALMLC